MADKPELFVNTTNAQASTTFVTQQVTKQQDLRLPAPNIDLDKVLDVKHDQFGNPYYQLKNVPTGYIPLTGGIHGDTFFGVPISAGKPVSMAPTYENAVSQGLMTQEEADRQKAEAVAASQPAEPAAEPVPQESSARKSTPNETHVSFASKTEKQSMLDNLKNATTKEEADAAWATISKSYQSTTGNIGHTAYTEAKRVKADLDKKFSSNETVAEATKPAAVEEAATSDDVAEPVAPAQTTDEATSEATTQSESNDKMEISEAVAALKEEILNDDLADIGKTHAQLYSETLAAEQKINHIFKNSFYTASQPVPKWSFSVDFIPTDEACKQYGGQIFEWAKTMTKAVQSVQLPSRESTSVKSRYKGISIELPARTKNASDFNIVFAENENAEIMNILYSLIKTAFNTSYPTGEEILSKLDIATEVTETDEAGNQTSKLSSIDIAEPTYRMLLLNHGHLFNIVVSLYRASNAHAFNMYSESEPSFVYMFHMCDMTNVGGATYDYRSDKPIDITATFTYQYFEELSFAAYKAKYLPEEIPGAYMPAPAEVMNENQDANSQAAETPEQFKTPSGGTIKNDQLDVGSMTPEGAKAAELNKPAIQQSYANTHYQGLMAGYRPNIPSRSR